MLFNIFPDLFKGMLKGIIKALGIQAKAVKVQASSVTNVSNTGTD